MTGRVNQTPALSVFLIVAWVGGPTASALPIEGFAASIAFDVHLQDGGVVHEAIDGGERHGLIREDLAPFSERLVGGDQHGTPFVARSDQLEQHAGLGLVLGDVGEVVEDQQVVAVEFGDGGLERQLPPGDLQPLHEIAGSGEQHAPAVLDQCEAEGG